MNLKTIMLVGIAAATLAALVWFAQRSTDVPPPLPVSAPATLTSPTGLTQFTPKEQTAPQVPAPPQPLQEGDTVTTGPDGGCDLTFSGNTRVHLGPDTSVVIGAHGAQGATLGAMLLAGSATMKSPAGGVDFKIGTPMGVVQLPADKLAEVEIRFDQGVKVLAGEVSLTRPESQLGQVVLSGQEITVDGLRVATAPTAVDGLTLDVPKPPPPPLAALLQARAGRVQLRPRGLQAWQRVRRTAPINAGDVVRVAPDARAHVTLDDTMHVELGPRARFEMQSSVGGQEMHTVTSALTAGAAEVAIEGASPKKRAQVTVARGQVAIEPTVQAASVELTSEGTRTGVRVRFGKATLPGGTVVNAGNEAFVRNGAVVEGPKPAYPDAPSAPVGKATEIYFDEAVPPVNFVAPRARHAHAQADGPRVLQWSRDDTFAAVTDAEAFAGGQFARDRLPVGHSYFRTADDPAQVGELLVRHDVSSHCIDCRTAATVSDTGEKVVVRYERQLPQVRLTWDQDAATGASRLLLFRDSDLKTPVFEQPVEGTDLQLPDALLQEGTYHWYLAQKTPQAPMGHASVAPATRAINTLKIEREVVTDGLDIAVPRPRYVTQKGRLLSSGRVSRGATLRLNGKVVPVRADGSFKVPVVLQPGHNRLLYHVSENAKNVKYYLRDVTLSH